MCNNVEWKEKATAPKESCPVCTRMEGTVAMLFASQSEFEESEYYGGGDRVKGSDVATHAAWPGKNNIGRKQEDWWVCCPAHPLCGHSWEDFIPADRDEPRHDWWSDVPESELEGYAA